MYWLRMRIAVNLPIVDVFGRHWDSHLIITLLKRTLDLARALIDSRDITFKGVMDLFKKPASYKGVADDKIQAMTSYKVAVVVENSREVMTEKLFDAWFAGCIPVYVGPDISQLGFPAELFVTAEADEGSVREAITRALSFDLETFHASLRRFLDSKGIRETWTHRQAMNQVLLSCLEDSPEARG